jgi:hypothetical protein
MQHQCIKPSCGNNYESDDIDAYYCPSCDAERKQIAKQIDKQFIHSDTEPTVMQSFEAVAKTYDAPDGRRVMLARARDIL